MKTNVRVIYLLLLGTIWVKKQGTILVRELGTNWTKTDSRVVHSRQSGTC
jgi:hypothetical protein